MSATATTTINNFRVCGYCPATGKGVEDTERGFASHFIKVTKAAKKQWSDDDKKTTQRLFLSPEWTFRLPNKEDNQPRFYSFSDVHLIIQEMKNLSEKPSAKNMLIFGGSILWSTPMTVKDTAKKTIEVDVVYNTCPIVCNGEVVHLYHKQKWGGDTKGGQTVWGFGADLAEFLDDEEEDTGLKNFFKRLKKSSKKKEVLDTVFVYKNVKYGIEICNDHSGGGAVDQTVDVHIVISCGQTFQSDSNAARTGGVVLLSDANGGRFFKDMCFRVVRVKNKDKQKFESEIGESGKVSESAKTFVGKSGWIYNEVVPITEKKQKISKKKTENSGGNSKEKTVNSKEKTKKTSDGK